ncbi:MAG TPA: arylsulfatase [Bacteroidetes bacterium]|nr:arylsulfatase [Bacteroidota bacterium]
MHKAVWSIPGLAGWILAGQAAGAQGTVGKTRESDRLPNIVIVLTDDMGYGDIGCFGATGFDTPHLDRLAANGMRFTNFYVAQAVSSASRAGLLTGCYSNRVGIGGFIVPASNIGINPDETTMAEMLKTRGYTTAVFGKWHVGHRYEFLPLQQGFDEFYGLPYSHGQWPYGADSAAGKNPKFPPLHMIEGNDEIFEINTMQQMAELTATFTMKAVEFIGKNKGNPFFLYLAHPMPHVPLAVSDRFRGKSRQGLYGDVVMEIDWSVGEIMKALKENGMENNTLVIFTSDNGPWLKFGNHAGSAGGLKEGKLTTWEGGQRVPCIMSWPGHIPAGTICNETASTIDLFPTLAGIVNAPLPEKKIDGVDILPLMTGVEGANPRDEFVYFFQFADPVANLEAVRKGQWKLVFPHTSINVEGCKPGMNGRGGEDKRVKVGYCLYDLRRDPGEHYDVKEFYPGVVEELMEIADRYRQDLGDKLTGVDGKNRRPPGRAKKNNE